MTLDWQHQFLIKLRSGPHVLNPLPHLLHLSYSSIVKKH